jgi:hypothetical protein
MGSGENVYNIGNCILQYDQNKSIWKYTANPALKTKPAAVME